MHQSGLGGSSHVLKGQRFVRPGWFQKILSCLEDFEGVLCFMW